MILTTSVSVGLPRAVIDILQGQKVADGREVAVIGSLTSLNFYYSSVTIQPNCLGPLISCFLLLRLLLLSQNCFCCSDLFFWFR